jgi:DNA mismatch repair protein PMS2
MASIKPIEGGSIHKIQSGQVIVDLCSVVKELVENSLDAGSSSVEIRFKSNGLEAIEVQDNGSGISPQDYESIALKHYTSKLRSYDDLESLQTFGFRGEALSSLCALSNLHIITAREEESPRGTRLDFEVSGRLKGTQIVAAQRGTTVVVETIFKNLPVRRQELEKNIKREYGKVLGLLQAYACVNTGVRISVSNVVSKGKKIVQFATKSNQSTRDNIANVFGAKTLSALMPLRLDFEMQPTSSIKRAQENKQVEVVGHISKPVVGEGRSLPDRQMYFVNGRPCALPQIAKVINEVYKDFNHTQTPFVFANVLLDTNTYDVNVSPDKRTILLHDQAVLLQNIRTSLLELFEEQQQTVPRSQSSSTKPQLSRTIFEQNQASAAVSTISGATDTTDENFDQESWPADTPSRETQPDIRANSLISQFLGRKTTVRFGRAKVPTQNDEIAASVGKEKYQDSVSKNKQRLLSRMAAFKHTDVQMVEDEDEGDEMARRMPEKLEDKHKTPEQEPHELLHSSDEEPIPSIPNVQSHRGPGMVQNAFDRMRPLRSPAKKATITIGSHTTTTIIGSAQKRTPFTKSLSRVVSNPRLTQRTFGKSLSQFSLQPTQDTEADEDGSGSADNESEGESIHSTGSMSGEGQLDEKELEVSSTDPKFNDTAVTQQEVIEDGSDGEYLDERSKKAQEDAKIARMIQEAEAHAAKPSVDDVERARKILKGGQKISTTAVQQTLDVSVASITDQLPLFESTMADVQKLCTSGDDVENTAEDPEQQLSMTVSKGDFAKMQVCGQFNLGFIIALRPAEEENRGDELFIIDQHASDEKYNFERLQATTLVQNQRLVKALRLDLTAVEEEVVLQNQDALIKNGFLIDTDESGTSPVGQRCRLTSLPMSREVTFSIQDLEELIALLAEAPSTTTHGSSAAGDGSRKFHNTVVRPSKVRRMFAMRACRSSVMVGKTLTISQMQKLLTNMGELDKPWNCPHGRPTMRHLRGLKSWTPWQEDHGVIGFGEEGEAQEIDWTGFLKSM